MAEWLTPADVARELQVTNNAASPAAGRGRAARTRKSAG